MINVGIASEIITPARGVALAGYFDPRPNTGAHDDLKVRVTLFRQGSVITGFVSYDLCFICMNIIEAVRQKLAAAGMNFGGELIFHAIHTHTAPYPAPFFGSDSTDKEYLADLVDASFRAIRRAYKNLAPAELFCAKENNNPLAFNRRYFMKNGKVVTNPGKLNPDIVKPEGPVDEEITVMAIRQDGRISAVLANIVNHTDTIGDDFVSADWPGRMEHTLQTKLGSDVQVSMMLGCSGNINHFDVTTKVDQTSYAEAKRIGGIYADIVAGLIDKAEKISDDTLQTATETVEIARRTITDEEVRKAEKIMEETKHFDGGAAMTSEELAAGAGPVLRFFAKQLLAFVKDWQGVPAEFEFKSFKIGKDFIAVSFPGEPFTQIGMAVKAESCARYNFMVTLAMGEAGYICMEECYSRGGYEILPISETGMAYNAANIFIETGKKLLKRYV